MKKVETVRRDYSCDELGSREYLRIALGIRIDSHLPALENRLSCSSKQLGHTSATESFLWGWLVP
jgi:hypothetical protein